MKAQKIDPVPEGTLTIDNLSVYYDESQTTVSNLQEDIQDLENILNIQMKFVSVSQPSPSQLKKGMVWFKLTS